MENLNVQQYDHDMFYLIVLFMDANKRPVTLHKVSIYKCSLYQPHTSYI